MKNETAVSDRKKSSFIYIRNTTRNRRVRPPTRSSPVEESAYSGSPFKLSTFIISTTFAPSIILTRSSISCETGAANTPRENTRKKKEGRRAKHDSIKHSGQCEPRERKKKERGEDHSLCLLKADNQRCVHVASIRRKKSKIRKTLNRYLKRRGRK